jgi:CBS domain-containing protein
LDWSGAIKISDRREFQTKPAPLTCSPEDTVLSAVERMAEANFGSVVAVDHDRRVLGMMTERDIFRRVVAECRDPRSTRVADVMTSELRLARADDDMLGWLRLMSNERFRRLPVVDEDGRLIAVMSQGDFVSYTWPELFAQAKNMARATIGPNISLPVMLVGILLYTLAIVIGIAVTVSRAG